MNSNPEKMSEPGGLPKKRRKLLMPLLAAAAVIIVVVVYFAVSGDSDSKIGELFTVKKSPLVITISESGTIGPTNEIILLNELEGMSRILYLIPESTQVKKGDLLVELDTSDLETQKVNQEIQVKNAEASFIQARENLAVVQSQAESDVAQARLNQEFAELDYKKYVEGEHPQEVEQAKANITIAEEELKRAQDRLEGSRRLAEKNFISRSDLQADELAAKQKEINVTLARSNLQLLETYTHPRKLKELESNIEQAIKALERVKRKASADVVQAEAQYAAKEAEFNKQKDTLQKIITQISKAKILAPQDGMVVYATTANRAWWSNEGPLAEGQQVRERQDLIHLPTSEGMKAEIKINESALGKVKAGLPVTVRVDALDGENIFAGKVTKISPMPDSQSRHMNPDLSVYSAEVQLEGDTTGLRTGMSCQVEILVAEYENVMPVPIQCVMQVNGKPTVYVQNGDKAEPRTVKIGLDNNRMVAVLSGLKENEKILLNPPLSKASVSTDNRAVFNRAKEEAEAKLIADADAQNAKSDENAHAKTDNEEAKSPDKTAAEEMRKKFENMTPEERQEMRKKFESMTPEERRNARSRRSNRSDGDSSSPSSPPPPPPM